MSIFRTIGEFEECPGYLAKLRVYFDRIAPQMIQSHNRRRNGAKGCWVTTIVPSLIDRQIRMSTGNLSLGANMIETEFMSVSAFTGDMADFLKNCELQENLPVIVVNSLKTIDNAHLIIVGHNADQSVWELGSVL